MLPPEIRQAVAQSFLGQFAPERVEPLLARSVAIEVPARSVLPQSSYQSFSALLADGLARLYVTGPKGRAVTLGYLRPGRMIFTIIPGVPEAMRIQAITRCQVWLVPADDARAWIASHADFGNATTGYMLSLIYDAINDFRFNTFATVRQRVARHLIELGSVDGGDAEMNAQELADTVGSVREVVGRVLKELESEQLIAPGAQGMRVIDPERLRGEFADLLGAE